MRNFFDQFIKSNIYIIVKNPLILVRFLLVYGGFSLIVIFIYFHFHLQDFIISIIENINDFFSGKNEVVEKEVSKSIEEPKVESNSTDFSTTTIIIGVTLAVVVLSGSTGAGLIILSIVSASGGWGGP